MVKLTSKERFTRMYDHKEADRVPITDGPWATTIERWEREGMPKGMPFQDYFDIDRVIRFSTDNSPRYPERVIEETEKYKIYTTKWGVTLKQWKHAASTPEFIDFKITNPDIWKEAKARMTPTRDRIDWNYLKANYKTWKEKGHWLQAIIWFGFDVTHSWMVGTENFLIAMLEEPEWCVNIFNHYLDMEIALWDMIFDEGYEFDCFFWYDDMGYKQNQFFSMKLYRELLKPVHKRAIEWMHSKGKKTLLHSCGYVEPLIPELLEIGLDGLNPLEVKAGMDSIRIKEKYGKDLLLNGGINAVLFDHPDRIEAEIRRLVPILKKDGGFVFSSDHSVPDSVSLENFRHITDLAKELGKY